MYILLETWTLLSKIFSLSSMLSDLLMSARSLRSSLVRSGYAEESAAASMLPIFITDSCNLRQGWQNAEKYTFLTFFFVIAASLLLSNFRHSFYLSILFPFSWMKCVLVLTLLIYIHVQALKISKRISLFIGRLTSHFKAQKSENTSLYTTESEKKPFCICLLENERMQVTRTKVQDWWTW